VKIRFIRDYAAPLAGGGSRRIVTGTEMDLDPAKAQKLIAAKLAEPIPENPALSVDMLPPENPAALPRIGPAGELVIPLNAPRRYRWWQGGQPPSETLKELYEERAAILEYDGGLNRADAEKRAAELTGYQPTPKERKNPDE